MAQGRLQVTIKRRDRARRKLKRLVRWIREATTELNRDLRRKKNLIGALHTAAADRDRHNTKAKLFREEAAEHFRNGDPVKERDAENRLKWHLDQRDKADARCEKLKAELSQLNAKIRDLQRRTKRAVKGKRFWRKRLTGLIRKVIHLRELREQRRRGQPEFKPWMANGADWQNASPAARAFIARAVVLHGLTCTSMARTYVPAGGSVVSWHLVWNGGKAGDAAGSQEAMEDCQEAEHKRGLGLTGQLEMFGPINGLNLKYGSDLDQAEGSANENLHDTHVHLAEEDVALKAAA